MNKLNGGYVMLKYDASQEKLKDAYDSGKPVIVYDSNNKGLWARITESSGTYSIEALSDAIDDVKTSVDGKKLYLHQIRATNTIAYIFDIQIYTSNSIPFTASELYKYINNDGNPFMISSSGNFNFSGDNQDYPTICVSALSNKFYLYYGEYLNISYSANYSLFTISDKVLEII